MKVAGINIGGRSVSGFDTGICLPDMGILLDCGRVGHAARQCGTVLITHGHLDHIHGVIPHGYNRHMMGMVPSTFVVPPFLEAAVHEIFAFYAKIQHTKVIDYNVIVAHPGEKVEIGGGRFVRSFRTIHRIPSQGYVIGETRKRLKPEFVGLEGCKLGEMRRAGVSFEEEFESLLVAFTGDTQARVFDRDIEALRAKVLISECTFINGEVSVLEARRKGHVHLDEIVERAERFARVEALVLAHFSHRHRNADVEAALAGLPPSLRDKTTYLPV